MISSKPKPTEHRESHLLNSRVNLTLCRRMNRTLLMVVTREAIENPAFGNKILGLINVPSNDWSICMYDRLRTRLEISIWKFDCSSSNTSNRFDVVSTSRSLSNLISAIESMTKPTNWRMMQHTTRLQYFGLLLDFLRNVVAADRDHLRSGSRSGSGGSSPYAVDLPANHNLYQRMVEQSQCTRASALLHKLLGQLQGPLDPRQGDQIRTLLDDVKAKHRRHGTNRSGVFVERLRGLRDGTSTTFVSNFLQTC
jgi:hypothetical protein